MLEKIRQWLNPPFRIYVPDKLTPADMEELHSEAYEDFKRILLKFIQIKMNENLYLLVHGKYVSDENRGVLQGVVRVYEDLILAFTKPKEKKDESYQDPVKRIKEEVEKEMQSKE